MLISSNSFYGKSATKRNTGTPIKQHKGTENFAQHFSFYELLLPAELPRVGPTLLVTQGEVSQTLLQTAP